MYVITGATGHTGKLITESLLAAGKPVKAIARNPEKLAHLSERGATIIAADLGDASALTEAFRGATAVYLMIPPKMDVPDWRAYLLGQVGVYAQAVRDSGVKKVVVLSSVGAHRTEGNGPVGGLGALEIALQSIPGLDVLALRPGYFMENLYGSVGMIQHAGINGGVQKADLRFPIIHTRDIATVAAKRLLSLDFQGFSHEFIAGPTDLNFKEITAIVGKAIGKPELPYIEFSSADGKAGMVQAGLPETIANGYVEIAEAMNSGVFFEGYTRTPEISMPTTLEWFVENELKRAFN